MNNWHSKQYGVSYATLATGGYTGRWRVPGDPHWRGCLNAAGATSEWPTPEAAEADAGKRLAVFLNRQSAA